MKLTREKLRRMIFEEKKGLEITRPRGPKSEYQKIMESQSAPLLAEDQYASEARELADYIEGLGVDSEAVSGLFSLLGSFGLEDGLDTWMDDHAEYHPILRRKRDQIETMAKHAGYIPIR